MPFDPMEASISELQAAMTSGKLSSVDLVAYYSERIARLDRSGPELNAVRIINPDAQANAAALDAERKQTGPRSLLHGIPVLVKDNYETNNMSTTAGAKLLENLFTQRDSEAVHRLRNAGAVILGKTNMHEFAYGITTAGSLFGQTRNPYDINRNAGGSSGGTGAAIAANLAAVGMGSDTCGSIRIPASHNNLVGLRGTQGLSSRFGIVPLSSTQDIGGPLARSTADLAIVLDATVGVDDKDEQTQLAAGNIPASYFAALDANALQGATLGYVTNVFTSSINPQSTAVRQAFDAAMVELQGLGVNIVKLDIEELNDLLAGDLNGFRVLIEDFKWDIGDYLSQFHDAPVNSLEQIIAAGSYHPSIQPSLEISAATQQRRSPEYVAALGQHLELRILLEQTLVLQQLDALVYPSIGAEPLPLGEYDQPGSNCRMSAKSGLPAISVPAGFTAQGLPVGMELLGRAWSEQQLLNLAHSYEQHTSKRVPPDLP